MLLKVLAFALLFPLAAALSGAAHAQQDTTPPVLNSFTITPAAFDTGMGPVVLHVCATATDDLSGVNEIAFGESNGAHGLTGGNIGFPQQTAGQVSGCNDVTVPAFSAYGTFDVFVSVTDWASNRSPVYTAQPTGTDLPLCPLGTCELVNGATSATTTTIISPTTTTATSTTTTTLAVYGCANARTGRLRSIGVRTPQCRAGEFRIFWNGTPAK
jgi:hypothetical protein